jgi:hypothetical protein
MSAWPRHELRQIAETDDLTSLRSTKTAGRTARHLDLIRRGGRGAYVRPYNGRDSRWYQAAMRQKAGRITAAGMTKEVAFEPTGEAISDRIDEAYREKYQAQPYLEPMLSTRTRSATVKVVARPTTEA